MPALYAAAVAVPALLLLAGALLLRPERPGPERTSFPERTLQPGRGGLLPSPPPYPGMQQGLAVEADGEHAAGPGYIALAPWNPSPNPWSGRSSGGRKRAIAREGGSRESEAAVEAGLRWFAAHQSPDGSWPLRSPGGCGDSPLHEAPPPADGADGDLGATSLALLCFLGAGYDHREPNQHRSVVRKGIAWLRSLQQPDGEWAIDGDRSANREQAMAVQVLAEAFGMTADPQLAAPLDLGIAALLARRALVDGPGSPLSVWGDLQESDAHCLSTDATWWSLQALRSARAAGRSVGDGLEGGERWLQALWDCGARNEGLVPGALDILHDETSLAAYYDARTDRIPDAGDDLEPVTAPADLGARAYGGAGLLLGLQLGLVQGRAAGDPLIETLANGTVTWRALAGRHPDPSASWYATQAFFQLDGQRWTAWNALTRDVLVAAQRGSTAGCAAGSWDPNQSTGLGRPVATALQVLSLEVSYRSPRSVGIDAPTLEPAR